MGKWCCVWILSRIFFVTVLLSAVSVSTQDPNELVNCYANDNCDGTSPVLGVTRDSCCSNLLDPVGYSVCTGLEECQRCPIVVGFSPANFTGEEQGEGHTVMAGYLSGRPPGGGILSLELRLTGTAVAGDVDVTTRVRALSNVPLSPVTISLRVDGVAQEVSETFSLEFLDPPLDDVNFFPVGVPVTIGHLNGTIIDGDRITFQLAEADFIQREGPNAMMVIPILKDQGIRLANPVRFKITPLTVDEAERRGIVVNFTLPTNDNVSPSRADANDFNATAFEVTLPSDEGLPSGLSGQTVFIPITDDEIDEAEEQFFITFLEVLNAVNLDLITVSRTIGACIIIDNDDTRIGYAQSVYSFPEPDFEILIREITLIRQGASLSEQTFTVAISVGNPGGTTQSATLESDDPLSNDFRIASPNNSITLTFPASAEFIIFPFFLNGDEIPEGLEAFRATSTPNENSPTFQSPDPMVGGAFATTDVRILDNDFAIVGFVQPSYTISESGVSQQVCVEVFSPSPNEPLLFDIFVAYETRTGTADGSDYTEDQSFVTFLAAISNGMPRVVCFDIFITDDLLYEEDVESFTITLELDNLLQSGIIVQPNVNTIFIEDDDDNQLPPTLPDQPTSSSTSVQPTSSSVSSIPLDLCTTCPPAQPSPFIPPVQPTSHTSATQPTILPSVQPTIPPTKLTPVPDPPPPADPPAQPTPSTPPVVVIAVVVPVVLILLLATITITILCVAKRRSRNDERNYDDTLPDHGNDVNMNVNGAYGIIDASQVDDHTYESV